MIKIQFFLHDLSYNYAITSLEEILLDQYGIALQWKHITHESKVKNHFDEKADLTLIHHDIFPEWLKKFKNSVALVPAVDGGWCTPYYHLIPHVKAIITSYTYTPRDLLKEPYFYYNMKLLRDAGIEAEKPQEKCFVPFPLNDEDLNKFHVFCGFGSWERMEGILNWSKDVDLKSERETPIHFMGTAEYCGNEIEFHRKKAVEVCRNLGGVGYSGRGLMTWKYHNELKNSRICLSPWGWGVACHRDWEALAMGCVLVKPNASFVESFPDLTSAQAPYIPCKLDFSDLSEIVELVTNHWDSYQLLRERGRKLAEEAVDKEKNAAKFAEIIEEIIC